MKLRYNDIRVSVGVSIALLCAACATEDNEPAGTVDTQEVSIVARLSASYGEVGSTTKAAPPTDGSEAKPELSAEEIKEMKNIDTFRFVTFRRRTSDAELNSNAPFYYDASNDMIVEADAEQSTGNKDDLGEGHVHVTGHGTLKKIYGFEYRVVALAYDSKAKHGYEESDIDAKLLNSMAAGAQNRFHLNLELGEKLKYDDFSAQMVVYDLTYRDNFNLPQNYWSDFRSTNLTVDNNPLTNKVYSGPQLFYGVCYTVSSTGDKSEIVSFAEEQEDGQMNKNMPIYGTLYRGMAEIEVHITPVTHNVAINYDFQWFALMSSNLYTSTGLTDYDDFLSPYDPVDTNADPAKQNYTPIAYSKVEKCYSANDANKEPIKLRAWVLPGSTRLAIRTKNQYFSEVRTKWLNGANIEISGENGTGIVSPDTHNGTFYLRRNHKYIITVENSDTFFYN